MKNAKNIKPLSICWNLTSACNLDCQFCYRVKGAKQLPVEDWEKVIEIIAKSGIKRIVVAGGEPLLVPNVERIFDLAKNHGLITSLITNGLLLTPARISKLSEAVDEIVLSIDGENKETHSNMRGCNLEQFDHLINCLYEIKKNNIRSRVNTLVSSQNINSVSGLGNRLIQCRVDEWRLMQFYPMNDAEKHINEFAINEYEFKKLSAEIISLYSEMLTITFGDNNNMSGSYFSLAPNGMVFTSLKGKMIWLGNIMAQKIETMSSGPLFDRKKHLQQYSVLEKWNVHKP